MTWKGVITNKGNVLLGRWVSGKTMTITKAAAGTGRVAEEAMLAQTSLVNEKQMVSILYNEPAEAGQRLKLQVTPQAEAYSLNQFGVWAELESEENMIALFQTDTETGVEIPSLADVPDFVYTFYGMLGFSSTGNLQVVVDPAALASMENVGTAVVAHNTNKEAHADLRVELKALNDRINAVLDSDDTTLDELSEIVAYIKSNKALIDAITTSKVNVADIVDNLVTNVINRPLSAAQGVVLKGLIDTLQTAVDGKAPTSHQSTATTYGAGSSSYYGHVKLSDSTSGTSGASGGVAATPAAVKAVYDMAVSALAEAASKAPSYNYGSVDLKAGESNLQTGILYFIYE